VFPHPDDPPASRHEKFVGFSVARFVVAIFSTQYQEFVDGDL